MLENNKKTKDKLNKEIGQNSSKDSRNYFRLKQIY